MKVLVLQFDTLKNGQGEKMILLSDRHINFLIQEIRGPGRKVAEKNGIDPDSIYYEAIEELWETNREALREVATIAYFIEVDKEEEGDPSFDKWRCDMAGDIHSGWLYPRTKKEKKALYELDS
jgi:hypothetical protein